MWRMGGERAPRRHDPPSASTITSSSRGSLLVEQRVGRGLGRAQARNARAAGLRADPCTTSSTGGSGSRLRTMPYRSGFRGRRSAPRPRAGRRSSPGPSRARSNSTSRCVGLRARRRCRAKRACGSSSPSSRGHEPSEVGLRQPRGELARRVVVVSAPGQHVDREVAPAHEHDGHRGAARHCADRRRAARYRGRVRRTRDARILEQEPARESHRVRGKAAHLLPRAPLASRPRGVRGTCARRSRAGARADRRALLRRHVQRLLRRRSRATRRARRRSRRAGSSGRRAAPDQFSRLRSNDSKPVRELVGMSLRAARVEIAARVHRHLGGARRRRAPRQPDQPDRQQRALHAPRQVEQILDRAERACAPHLPERTEQHPARGAPAFRPCACARTRAVRIAHRIDQLGAGVAPSASGFLAR